MEYFNIAGKDFSVIVLSIKETFNKIYSENTGRTLSEKLKMNLDCLGTFYGHTVVIKRKSGHEEDFDEIFDIISAPSNDGIPIKVAHNQETIDYVAYVSTGERDIKKIDTAANKIYWNEMSITFIPMEAYTTL